MKEKVLAVKKEHLVDYFSGYQIVVKDYININENEGAEEESLIGLIALHGEFLDRESAEKDYGYKQIIPYCVVNFGDYYFLTQRTKVQTEKRLHNAYSLGVGGHINPGDNNGGAYDYTPLQVRCGLYRELEEELYINVDEFTIQFAGIINENYTDAGKMHLGLVYVINMKVQNVAVRETEKMTGMWIHKDDLKNYVDKMESWSQIVYNNLV